MPPKDEISFYTPSERLLVDSVPEKEEADPIAACRTGGY